MSFFDYRPYQPRQQVVKTAPNPKPRRQCKKKKTPKKSPEAAHGERPRLYLIVDNTRPPAPAGAPEDRPSAPP